MNWLNKKVNSLKCSWHALPIISQQHQIQFITPDAEVVVALGSWSRGRGFESRGVCAFPLLFLSALCPWTGPSELAKQFHDTWYILLTNTFLIQVSPFQYRRKNRNRLTSSGMSLRNLKQENSDPAVFGQEVSDSFQGFNKKSMVAQAGANTGSFGCRLFSLIKAAP